MKKLSSLSTLAVSANQMSNIKGGTFCKPRPSAHVPAPVHPTYNGGGTGCAPVVPVCAPAIPVITVPTICIPKISISFGGGCGW